MANPVFNAVVSGIIEPILEKLGSAAFKEITQITGLKGELKRLEKTLSTINSVLRDAEEQQSTNKSIRDWLLNLKDVAYDIDDLLDLITIRDLERKVNRGSFSRKIMQLSSAYSLSQELKTIRRRLDDIAEDRRNYNFQEQQCVDIPHVVETNSWRETYSYIQESHIFGREQDKEWIVSRLLSSSISEVQQGLVIPIVGIGGMGKTTLAKSVFNDPRIKVDGKFELRLWAYVSNRFVLKRVIQNVIESATGQKFLQLNMEALVNLLRNILADRTYLLVLDDVWIEDSKQWLELKHLLVEGSRRSTIIVTTREERVASISGTTQAYKLERLSEDHCWSIFVKYAFSEHEEVAYSLLVQIGKSIIRKCRGVPLAVKTLGSLLRNERDDRTWKQIEKSELWMISQRQNDIFPTLKLSFDHTPQHLKSCFASCALFPKGQPLCRRLLIDEWMAQGLLQSQDGSEDPEYVGERYIDELLSRSFFQFPGNVVTEKYIKGFAELYNVDPYWGKLTRRLENNMTGNVNVVGKLSKDYRGKPIFVEMHDLMHDLAAYVAKEETANLSSNRHEISVRLRHLGWDPEDLSGKKFPKFLLKASKARTFAFFHPMGSLSKSFLEELLSTFKCLRMLRLPFSEFEELPDSIGDLMHLRDLTLSHNYKLKLLPNSTCKLVKLQALNVLGCYELETLPIDMHKLASLRTFILTSKLTCFPERSLQGLSSLRFLYIFHCPKLTYLPDCIDSLTNLSVLGIYVCHKLASLPNSMRVLTNLEELCIWNCKELDFTKWEGLHGLKSLRCLRLYGLPELLDFPDGLNSVAGSLQAFVVQNCDGLRRLPEDLQNCTSLLKLEVNNCCNLSALPRGIPVLKNLQELDITGCPELSQRCQKETGDDWHLISHIPRITIDDHIIQY